MPGGTVTDYTIPDDASELVDTDPPEFPFRVHLYSPDFDDTLKMIVLAPTLVDAINSGLAVTFQRIAIRAELVLEGEGE